MQEQTSIVIYTSEDGTTNLQVNLRDDTVWLTQMQMAELFGRDRTIINRHISELPST